MKMNLPNKLTILRIILSVVIILLLVFPWSDVGLSFPTFAISNITVSIEYFVCGVIFLIAGFTDFLDGKIARKRNMVTDLGKTLDAIADKVLVNSILIILAYQGFIPVIIPVVIVIRDIAVDAMKMMVAGRGKVQAAINSGKIKTASLMIGIVLMLFYNLPFELWGLQVADFFIYFGAIMSIVSMVEYFNITKKTMKLEDSL